MGKVGWAPLRTGSGAKSLTAIMDGVDTDFCSGNLWGSSLICSASLLALSLLKSFCKYFCYRWWVKWAVKVANL